MDTDTLVEDQIDDGQRLIDLLREGGFVVRAACWVKPVEEDRWSLYIASPSVDDKGAAAAYRQVYRVLRSLGDVCITDSDVRLIGERHSVAQEVFDIVRRYPGRMPTRSRQPLLGGMPIDELYVYAVESKSPVEVTIYGLVFRGEPDGCQHLSLEPHEPNCTLEVEREGRRIEYPGETGRDWLAEAPEGATLERNRIGLLELTWNLRGKKTYSNANEVWSLAKLGLHGFRFLREPVPTEA